MVRRESPAYKIFRAAFLIFFIAVFLLPIWWMIKTSLIARIYTVVYPPHYLPRPIEFEGYVRVWEHQGIPTYYFNTVFVNVVGAVLALVLGIPAAYAASRFEFRQKDNIMFTILSTRFLPPATALVPIFILFKWVRLVDSKWGLVIAYAGLNVPIVIWVLKSFMDEIPRAMEESYLLDGHSRIKSFFNIIIPLSAPGIAAMFMICNFLTWGEFLIAAVLTTTTSAQTLPVGAAMLEGDIGILWQQIAACGVMAAVPITLIIIFFQRYLVRGFSFGILK
ncbi:MAG: carbohydrate ABC transporter permease [Deltaproteobacteria bacterium]|nr:carbohydrate ABC transporter permease [Deltaproteobacteria bacterium]MBW2120585.1 carbohydrate ABC transporter permease [Deltaproteobacteria bacterium]